MILAGIRPIDSPAKRQRCDRSSQRRRYSPPLRVVGKAVAYVHSGIVTTHRKVAWRKAEDARAPTQVVETRGYAHPPALVIELISVIDDVAMRVGISANELYYALTYEVVSINGHHVAAATSPHLGGDHPPFEVLVIHLFPSVGGNPRTCYQECYPWIVCRGDFGNIMTGDDGTEVPISLIQERSQRRVEEFADTTPVTRRWFAAQWNPKVDPGCLSPATQWREYSPSQGSLSAAEWRPGLAEFAFFRNIAAVARPWTWWKPRAIATAIVTQPPRHVVMPALELKRQVAFDPRSDSPGERARAARTGAE